MVDNPLGESIVHQKTKLFRYQRAEHWGRTCTHVVVLLQMAKVYLLLKQGYIDSLEVENPKVFRINFIYLLRSCQLVTYHSI